MAKLEDKTILQLKKVLDIEYSRYIRKRDNNICYTCGAQANSNGHFVPRAVNRLRYDDINCHAQCLNCNYKLEGNWAVYELKLRANFGDDVIDEYIRIYKSHEYFRLEKDWLIEKIKYYRKVNKDV